MAQVNKISRVLVTGGTGFIGSYISKMFAALHPSVEILVMSRKSVQDIYNQDESITKFKNITFVEADCLEPESDSFKDAV